MKFLKKFLLLPILMLCCVMVFAACDNNTNPALVGLPDKAWSIVYAEGSTITTRTSFVVFTLDLSSATEISGAEYGAMPLRDDSWNGSSESDISGRSNLLSFTINRDRKINSNTLDIDSIGTISSIGVSFYVYLPVSSYVYYSVPVVEAKVYYQTLKVEGNLLKIQVYNITGSNGYINREITHNEIVLSNIQDASGVRIFNENGTLKSLDFGVSFQFFN